MTARTRLALAAAGLCLVGLLSSLPWLLNSGAVEAPKALDLPIDEDDSSRVRSDVGDLAPARGAPPSRAITTPSAPVPERSAEVHAFELEVLVHDELDLALRGAGVYLAPLRHPLNFVGVTDRDGRLVLRFRGSEAQVHLALFVESPDLERDRARGDRPGRDFKIRGGVLSGLRRIEVNAGEPKRIALAPRSDDVLGAWIARAKRLMHDRRLEDEEWDRLDSWLTALARSRNAHASWRDLPPSALGEVVPSTAPMADFDEEGILTFVAPMGPGGPELLARVQDLEEREDLEAAASLEFRQRRVSPVVGNRLARRRRARIAEPEEPEESVVTFRYRQPRGRRDDTTSLLITVKRADGEPAVGAAITLDRGMGLGAPVFADAEGQYLFHAIEPGGILVRAGGGDFGVLEDAFQLRPQFENTWEMTLERGFEVRGRLLDETGSACAHWQVELELTDKSTPHVDTTIADEEGRFAVPNMTLGVYRMLVRPPGPWGTVPTTVIDGVLPEVTENVYRIERDDKHRPNALLEVVDSTGEHRQDVEVRLWSEAYDRGVWFTPTGPKASLESMRLVPGPYRFVVGSASRGWSAPRAFAADTVAKFGLGVVMLDEVGLLLLEGHPPGNGVPIKDLRLVETSSGLDVLVADTDERVEFPLRLPAGEYRLEPSRGSSLTIELRAGETLRIDKGAIDSPRESQPAIVDRRD